MGQYHHRHHNSNPNNYVKEDWDSQKIDAVQKRTATDIIREKAAAAKTNFANKVREARRERSERMAYERSPQGRQAAIKKVQQEYQYESARTKLAKVKSQRRQAAMKGFGLGSGGMGSGLGSSGLGMGPPSRMPTQGFDSMFGFGSGGYSTGRRSKRMPRKSGFDEMFGF